MILLVAILTGRLSLITKNTFAVQPRKTSKCDNLKNLYVQFCFGNSQSSQINKNGKTMVRSNYQNKITTYINFSSEIESQYNKKFTNLTGL